MNAELIKIHTQDGRTHFGAFYPAQGEARRMGVVFVHGWTGCFVGEMESVTPGLVAQAGYACLVANNRGNGYMGAATEDFAGCIPDIAASIDFMEERGFDRVALIGHSKGGVKVAYYLTQTKDPRVARLGLLSPAPDVHSQPAWMAESLGRKDTEAFMEEVRGMVERGEGEKMISLPVWPFFTTARTLWDHYTVRGDEVQELVKGFTLPLLALCGETEMDWCVAVTMLVKATPANVRALIIPGADHVYTGMEDKVANAIVDWLEE